MRKNHLVRILRKIHRSFSIPMTILVVANVSTRKFEFNTIIENITAANMVLMTLSGTALFLFTARRKVKTGK